MNLTTLRPLQVGFRKNKKKLNKKVNRRDETILKWKEQTKRNFGARGESVSKRVSADVRDIMKALSKDLSDKKRVHQYVIRSTTRYCEFERRTLI